MTFSGFQGLTVGTSMEVVNVRLGIGSNMDRSISSREPDSHTYGYERANFGRFNPKSKQLY